MLCLISAVEWSDSILYIYIYMYFFIFFSNYGLSQDVGHSSLCNTIGLCCLSILCIIVYIWFKWIYCNYIVLLSIFIFAALFFNWRITALQNCVVFCQTSVRIGHRYTHVPPSWGPLPPPSPPHPSRVSRSPSVSSLRQTVSSHWLSILHTIL